ncbi:CG33988 [Drosophila busckii]|uniref:CG33988 n=1 Tax=Drosophila busckii TaxID=30019 RepID=A0A0M4EHH0_DROBS|nr:CG33988 [Drosophila busckii]
MPLAADSTDDEASCCQDTDQDTVQLSFDFYRRPGDEALYASSTRRARSFDEAAGAGLSAPESSEATLLDEEQDNSGLPVQYASSRAFDDQPDEDIFALVAEDDLLSEESFDRLIKLSEDADNAVAEREREREREQEQEEEDYSLTLTPQRDESQHQPVDESERVLPAEQKQSNSSSSSSNSNKKRDTAGEAELGSRDDAYASHLIAVGGQDGGVETAAASITTKIANTNINTTTTTATPVDLKKSILGTATALTRLNPWISACDLAQPGTTGIDLQGQCSAGTLPMAWVDEGPGPPICPRSCNEQQPIESASGSESSASSSDSKLKYFINTNSPNFKSRASRSSSNHKAMPKVRRELRDWAAETEASSTTTEQNEQQLELEQGTAAESSTTTTTTSTTTRTTGTSNADELPYSHLQATEQLSAKEHNEQQQQCLDYLGDAAETSPQHLCKNLRAPGQLLSRLRTLRLRHCCERSVFSALHTLALNSTLSDPDECVRLLSDLLDVDALANRITCELAEILFRFDCRQVYSLINQCDDCKEAYRRWVCSTLVPYFAEPEDVEPVPAPAPAADDLTPATNKSKRSIRTGNRTREREEVGQVVVALGEKHKSLKLISNNNKSNDGNNMNERQINQEHDEDYESGNANEHENENENSIANANGNGNENIQRFYHIVGLPQQQQQHSNGNGNKKNKKNCVPKVEQQFNNFISTANNADPSAMDPVISKLQKRSTRKTEFRMRRRIRPCLSVCQTVEQKCPYLLPADRAPALPTQYAGEPTFLCLDQNIPETGEQLKKSSYGPNDCCYSYCNGPMQGICTVCQEFAGPRNESGAANATSARRVHNITLTMGSPAGEHARAASVAVALRNVTVRTAAPSGAELLERLPYYARDDSVYYYDEDEGDDMPELAISGGCAAVPTVSSRCEIPYYASGMAPTPPTQLLVWLSALLGLLSSCGAGAARQRYGRVRGRTYCAASCHELLARPAQDAMAAAAAAADGASKRSTHKGNGSGSGRSSSCGLGWKQQQYVRWLRSWAWAWVWSLIAYKPKCRKVRYLSSGRSKFKGETTFRCSRILNYRDLQLIRIKCSARYRNYRYFYYYNYNINDWWRRWTSYYNYYYYNSPSPTSSSSPAPVPVPTHSTHTSNSHSSCRPTGNGAL